MELRQIKAVEQANKKRILQVCPKADEESGIYVFTREENGFKYAYIGQAKHILTRLAQHLSGYQHIDLSIKKHGLHNYNHPHGWDIIIWKCAGNELDNKEREFTLAYAENGYQLRNKTAGGQNNGKFGIDENKPSKGYNDGIRRGYRNAREEIIKLFKKHLTYQINGKENKLNKRAFEKFKTFLEVEDDNGTSN